MQSNQIIGTILPIRSAVHVQCSLFMLWVPKFPSSQSVLSSPSLSLPYNLNCKLMLMINRHSDSDSEHHFGAHSLYFEFYISLRLMQLSFFFIKSLIFAPFQFSSNVYSNILHILIRLIFLSKISFSQMSQRFLIEKNYYFFTF